MSCYHFSLYESFLFSINSTVFRHLKLEIAISIPALNVRKIDASNSFETVIQTFLKLYENLHKNLTQNIFDEFQ